MHLGPKCMYRYFPKHIAYTILFKGMVCIKQLNSDIIITAYFQKTAVLCLRAPEKGAHFWSLNVHFTRQLPTLNKLLYT
jgi:hypothetical protein